MKTKIKVPVTKVSANAEIQRLRELFKSGNLKLGNDGSIREVTHSINENCKDNKEITVPETVLSEPDNGGAGIRDLIHEMRGEIRDIESHPNDNPKEDHNQDKTIKVPDTILS